ncbi:protein SSUH2 homolog [Toxotes jaculatrix]|uniref:protein SSUH2 homolog n=1 Tax=Toxotes jaculatrix TaxID=941984 RepID=UPI001B3A9DE0|nr:protein SSUH2 homolog [Toxotes jaculatrix]
MDPPPEYSNSVPDGLPGYESMLTEGEGGLCHPPALFYPHPQPETQPSGLNWNIEPLSKDDAQQALIRYASEKCCYSTKPAEEGVITSMETFDTYRYRLETFTETRTTKWSQRPYYGEQIDNRGQTPPGPWEIPVNVPPFFLEGSQIIEVPHTSSVKACPSCNATGRVLCMSCCGTGSRGCYSCGGMGYTYFLQDRQMCLVCFGRGRTTCFACHGIGQIDCLVCLGKRKIIASIDLVVEWLNNMDQHTVEQSSGLKMVKLNSVSGETLFTDTNHMVCPVTNFPDPEVVQTSQQLLGKHQEEYLKTSRILQQRQTIELLPITKVTYEWKGKSHVFFVYGSDFKVSAVNYPAACCGCCTVM